MKTTTFNTDLDRLAERRVNARKGWGLGLLIHGLVVFVWGSGSRLRAGMVQRERERLQHRQARGQ